MFTINIPEQVFASENQERGENLESPLLEFKAEADDTKEVSCSQTPVSNNYATMQHSNKHLRKCSKCGGDFIYLLFGLDTEEGNGEPGRCSKCKEQGSHTQELPKRMNIDHEENLYEFET